MLRRPVDSALTAVVRMQHRAGEATPVAHHGGDVEGVGAQPGAHVVGQRPPELAAGEHVEDRAQIEPALDGGDLGQVGEPQLVGLLRAEVGFDQVGKASSTWDSLGPSPFLAPVVEGRA